MYTVLYIHILSNYLYTVVVCIALYSAVVPATEFVFVEIKIYRIADNITVRLHNIEITTMRVCVCVCAHIIKAELVLVVYQFYSKFEHLNN